MTWPLLSDLDPALVLLNRARLTVLLQSPMAEALDQLPLGSASESASSRFPTSSAARGVR